MPNPDISPNKSAKRWSAIQNSTGRAKLHRLATKDLSKSKNCSLISECNLGLKSRKRRNQPHLAKSRTTRRIIMNSDQISLRIQRIEQQLGLSTDIELIRCAKCGEIKHQPQTMGNFPDGVCSDCVRKEQRARRLQQQ